MLDRFFNEPWLFKLHQWGFFLESVREALFNYHGVDNLAGANEEKCGLAWPSSKTIPQRRENCKLILFSLFSQLFRSNLYLMYCPAVCLVQTGQVANRQNARSLFNLLFPFNCLDTNKNVWRITYLRSICFIAVYLFSRGELWINKRVSALTL